MIIHTVGVGDTVFNIARKYGVAPQKIIENNELLNPDRLTVGEKLMIFTPTRTYTVRGNDTLRDIADRFSVSVDSLKRKNPFLNGGESLYPGQILAIRGAEPRHGLGIANGYLFKGATAERIALAMPYLTYLTVGNARRKGCGIDRLFDDREVVKEARVSGVMPHLRIYDDQTEYNNELRKRMIDEALSGGYGGITLASYRGMKEERERTEEHIARLREMANENGLRVFMDIDGNADTAHSDVADGYIIFYGKCHLPEMPTFENGEMRLFEQYADTGCAPKTFIDTSATAYAKDEALSKNEAIRLARGAGREIDYDDALKISSFEYNRYLGGKREGVRVAYEPPENIKAKLDLVRELGYMGISFDIMHIPTEYLLMLEELFSHPEGHPDM